MTDTRLAVLCLAMAQGGDSACRRLKRLLEHVPAQDVEVRLALPQGSPCLHYALGRLCPDAASLEHALLPQGVERFRIPAPSARPFCCWSLPAPQPAQMLLRWLWCDLPLTTEYVLWIDDATELDAGWWRERMSTLRQGGDVFGPWVWRDFLPGEIEWLLAQSWYRGAPFLTRLDRLGVEALEGGWLAFRVSCLRQAGLFDKGLFSDSRREGGRVFVWLAEMARQLGWRHTSMSQALFSLAGDANNAHPSTSAAAGIELLKHDSVRTLDRQVRRSEPT